MGKTDFCVVVLRQLRARCPRAQDHSHGVLLSLHNFRVVFVRRQLKHSDQNKYRLLKCFRWHRSTL